MPVPYFAPGLGPDPLEKGDTKTFFAAADTNATANLITPGMPVNLPTAPNDYNLTRPVADTAPTGIAVSRQDTPNGLVTVRILGNAVIGQPPAGHFVEDLAYTGGVAAGANRQVLADGAGAWKIVAAGLGIGRVLEAAGGRMKVRF